MRKRLQALKDVHAKRWVWWERREREERRGSASPSVHTNKMAKRSARARPQRSLLKALNKPNKKAQKANKANKRHYWPDTVRLWGQRAWKWPSWSFVGHFAQRWTKAASHANWPSLTLALTLALLMAHCRPKRVFEWSPEANCFEPSCYCWRPKVTPRSEICSSSCCYCYYCWH